MLGIVFILFNGYKWSAKSVVMKFNSNFLTLNRSMCCKTRGRDTALGRSRRSAAVRQRGKLQPDLDLWLLGTDVNLTGGVIGATTKY